jgi:serine/threonine protein kinase
MNGPWDVSALPKGTLIGGRFEVQTILGIGGFGITYAAWDHHLQRHVAVKEFLPSDVTRTGDGRLVTRNDDAFRTGLDRFFQEGRILAGLRHPGIVGVFDVLAESGTAYLVMEFLVGETFEQSLQRVGRYSAEEVQNVAAQLVAALAFLHNELGDPGRPPLLHLDVSPSNVILHQTENCVRPVLIDLGSARNIAATQSHEFSRIVKAGFSAPELYSANQPRTARADVYSLAATLYHLITGVVPVDCLERAQGAQLVPVSQLVSGVPSGLTTAIERGLELRAELRPATATTFLQLCLSSPEVPVTTPVVSQSAVRSGSSPSSAPTFQVPTPVEPQGGRPVRPGRNRALVVAALVGLVAVLGVVVGFQVSKQSNGSEIAEAVEASRDPTSPVTAATDVITGGETKFEEPVGGDDPTSVSVDSTLLSEQRVPTPARSELVERRLENVTARSSFQRKSVQRKCPPKERLSSPPSALVDGDDQTGWGASAGDGAGASIDIDLGGRHRVTRIGLIPGFVRVAPRGESQCQSLNAFFFNRVVREVEYRFDDGSRVTQQFRIEPAFQYIDLDVRTSTIRLTILETQATGDDSDTILSELEVFAAEVAQ